MAIKEPMRLDCDRKVAINLANNHILYDRTKHVKIDRHFIRKKIDSKKELAPDDQMVNMFTTNLSFWIFERNIRKLDIFDMYSQLEGEC